MRNTCNQSVKRGREAMERGGGGGGEKKADAAKKKEEERKKGIFKERDGLIPRRGSCGSTCLLRHECDRSPPGPGGDIKNQ